MMNKEYLQLLADKLKLSPIKINMDISSTDYFVNELEKFAVYVLDLDSKEFYVDVIKNRITLVECSDNADTDLCTIEINNISFVRETIDFSILHTEIVDGEKKTQVITMVDMDIIY